MCFVLDANAFHSVFDQGASDHAEFAPVHRWIFHGAGFLVYGGATYGRELKRAVRYLGIFTELKKSRRAKEIDGGIVDQHEKTVAELVGTADCDDCHLIAIFRASGCLLLCSNDERADPYIKDRRLYGKGQKPPSIYRSSSHKGLLNKSRIVKLRNLI